jgi:hypothetical protein
MRTPERHIKFPLPLHPLPRKGELTWNLQLARRTEMEEAEGSPTVEFREHTCRYGRGIPARNVPASSVESRVQLKIPG